MTDLLHFKAKVCWTAAGMLIHEGRVLLIKHKKVGFWLNPGGHVEGDELPHQTAEREFWEETAIKVRAMANHSQLKSERQQYLPNPIVSNVHWVCQDNYETRVNGKPPTEYATKRWSKGCEQHLGFVYLVEPIDGVDFKENIEETDGIAWFTPDEVKTLDTSDEVKQEVALGFALRK